MNQTILLAFFASFHYNAVTKMKKLTLSFILYIVIVTALVVIPAKQTFALTQCQVIYGGGQMCQGQQFVRYTYPVATPANTPTPPATPTPQVPTTTTLPSTGASWLSYVLIVGSAIAGIAIKLFLL